MQSLDFYHTFPFKDSKTIRQLLAQPGLKNSNMPVTLYCQSAHGAWQAYFTQRQVGFEKQKKTFLSAQRGKV